MTVNDNDEYLCIVTDAEVSTCPDGGATLRATKMRQGLEALGWWVTGARLSHLDLGLHSDGTWRASVRKGWDHQGRRTALEFEVGDSEGPSVKPRKLLFGGSQP